MRPLIYLDHNATTPVDPAVLEEMLPFLKDDYGNPSSVYSFGTRVRKAIDLARERVAAFIGCEPGEVTFTSCGTESNNAVIQSAMWVDRDRQHLVTTAVEHSAIMKHAEVLARRGHPVTLLPVDAEGRLSLDEVAAAITDETAILSVMWANNETGVVFPVEKIAEIAREKDVLFHTDAVQAVGKLPIGVSELGIHALSISGHKLYCPKGVGALYINRRSRFHPYLIGGGQEGGRRGGTENVASIVALGKAAELAAALQHTDHMRGLRDYFEAEVFARIEGVQINGHREDRLPNTSNLSFSGVEAEGLLFLLDKDNICASAGSACTTGSLKPSHVLSAMGLSADRARSSIRFSFGKQNTHLEVDQVLEVLVRAVDKMRSLRPPGPVAMHR